MYLRAVQRMNVNQSVLLKRFHFRASREDAAWVASVLLYVSVANSGRVVIAR